MSSSLHFRIRGVIAEAIVAGWLVPGDVLFEAIVAEALLTSRTPVRTALELLREEGRLVKLLGRGYGVAGGDGASPKRLRRIDREAFVALPSASEFGGRAPAAWSRIYAEVEAEVGGGAIFGPLRIIELEIAKIYGVSRTVARDVLSRIERVGLIYKDERNFWRVTPLTAERASDLYELRRALEPVALRRAIEGGRYHAARDMRDRLATAYSRLPYVTPLEICAFERELHIDLISLCDNPEIIQALRVGQLQLAANRQLFAKMPHGFRQILSEHLAVADRLADDDVDGAAEALRHHLCEAKVAYIEHVTEIAALTPATLPPYLQFDPDDGLPYRGYRRTHLSEIDAVRPFRHA